MFLSTDSGQAAITGRFLSPAKPHQVSKTAGHTGSRMPMRVRTLPDCQLSLASLLQA